MGVNDEKGHNGFKERTYAFKGITVSGESNGKRKKS